MLVSIYFLALFWPNRENFVSCYDESWLLFFPAPLPNIQDDNHDSYQNVKKYPLPIEEEEEDEDEDAAQQCPPECEKIYGREEGDVLRGNGVCNCFFPQGGMNSMYPSQGTNFIIGASEDDILYYEDDQIDIFVGEDGSMEVEGCSVRFFLITDR